MKILVIGAAGMLGHQCFLRLSRHFGSQNVAATLRKAVTHYSQQALFRGVQVFDQLDVTNFVKLQNILNQYKPQVIVNCVGLTLRKPELSDFEKALEINAMLPHRLAQWGLANNSRIIHFSTDCVFSGKKGNYHELDIPDAADVYGKTKFLGEISSANSLTLRLSIVGRELEGKTELIEWFLAQKNKSISGYAEVMYSGLTTNVVADEVVRLIVEYPRLSGVYQMSSQPISKYELLQIVNRVYDNNVKINKNTEYQSNKVLLCDKYIKATGFARPDWESMIQQMRKDELQFKESVNYGN